MTGKRKSIKISAPMAMILILLPLAAALCVLLFTPSPAPEYAPGGDLGMPSSPVIRPYGIVCCAGAVLAMLAAALLKPRKTPYLRLAAMFALCLPLSLLCSRLMYCLCSIGKYTADGAVRGMLFVQNGGWMMGGVFIGAALSCLICASSAEKGAGRREYFFLLLNALAVPLLTFIVFERFGEYFTGYGRGLKLKPNESSLCFFPIFTALQKNGRVFRYELSVWFLEGLYALICLTVFIINRKKISSAFVSTLILYCAGQIVFESLLTCDCPKWGAFVNVNMVLSGAVLLGLTVIFALRRKSLSGGVKALRIALCLLILAVCGGCEWALDKTEIPNPVVYGVMALCCVLCAANALTLRKNMTASETGIKAE